MEIGETPCTVTQRPLTVLHEMTTRGLFLHFISVSVCCPTRIYYMVITAIFRWQESVLVDDKAQESRVQESVTIQQSWKPEFTMSPNRVLTHTVLPQTYTYAVFFFPLTPFYPQTAPPFSASSVLQ